MNQLPLLSRAIKAIAMIGLIALTLSISGDRSLQAQEPPGFIIDNGTVQLGVNSEGHLIVPGGTLSRADMPNGEGGSPGVTDVGLRFIPTNGEAIAPGCPCEGWGIAANTSTGIMSARANKNEVPAVTNMTVEPGTEVTNSSGDTKAESVGSAFKSVVTAFSHLRVTHDIHPSSASPNLYEIDVTVQNIGLTAVGDVLYRRVMDFDVPPTTFWEHVEIRIPTTFDGILFRATTDGFMTADPSSFPEGGPSAGDPPTTLSYESGDPKFYAGGPTDQGASFDLSLAGPLAGMSPLQSGQAKAFTIYYGAAASRAEALQALSAVGATAYALGISSTSFDVGASANNNDNVFIFGYGVTSDGTYNRTWDFGNHSFSLDSDANEQFPAVAVTVKESPTPESFATALYGPTILPMGPGPVSMFTLYTVHNSPPTGFGSFLHTYIARDTNTIVNPPCRPRLLHLYSTGPQNDGTARDETIEYYPIPPASEASLDLFPDVKLRPLIDDPGIGSESDGFGGKWQPVDLGDPDGPFTDRFDEWVTPNPDGSTVVNQGSTLVVKFRYTAGPAPEDPRLSVAKLDDSVQGFEPQTFEAPGESFRTNVFKCDSLKLECRINFKTTNLTDGTYIASVNSLSFCVKEVEFGVRSAKKK